MKAEAERRRTQGVAGEWEVVEQSTSTKQNDDADATPESSKKREAEEPPDPEDARNFKLRKRAAPSVTDDWDSNLIPIKLKPKKTEEVPELNEVKDEGESSQPTEAAPIKWTARGWKRSEDGPDRASSPTTPNGEEAEITPVSAPEPGSTLSEPRVKEEPEVSPVKVEQPAESTGEPGAVFRKRKFRGKR
jgi:WW domain-binding protein 4